MAFTLIELLVAFGFVAVATVSILALVRSSLRLLSASRALSQAAQASVAPHLPFKELGVRTRDVRTEEMELGPIRIKSVLIEVIPGDKSEGVRMRVYK